MNTLIFNGSPRPNGDTSVLISALMEALEDRVLILDPHETYGVDTLCKDVKALKKLYEAGYESGAEVRRFLQQ